MGNLNVIVAFAADNIDEEARNLSISDSVDDLSQLNQRIHKGAELFKLWAEAKGGRAIATGAGSGRVEVGADHIEYLTQLQDQFEKEVGSSCSIGVGAKLSEAEKALKYAQLTGGKSIELYTEDLEADLANAEELRGQDEIFDAFFDKAEGSGDSGQPSEVRRRNPGKFRSKGAGIGGGMTGASKPKFDGFDKPVEEADEHSENQVLQDTIEQAPDLASSFGQLADESQADEESQKEAELHAQQQEEQGDDLRTAVVEVLKEFKDQAPLWEQLKQASPEGYKTLTNIMKAMVALARQAFAGGDDQQSSQQQSSQQSQSASVAKMEKALEPGKTGRHQVVLPVGSQIDSAPNATQKVGRIKILGRASGKTKWRQVRAGLVMDPEGNPTSSRNPSGGIGQ